MPECDLDCVFFLASNEHHGVCVQLHCPPLDIHFFTIIPLGRVDKAQLDRHNPWYMGLLDEITIPLRSDDNRPG